MTVWSNQRGVSIIAAIFILVIIAFMGVIFVSLIGTGSVSSLNDLQSARALFVADGGIEYVLQNRAFPNYSMGGATMNLATGTFTVDTPTYLTADPGAAGVVIPVQSTASFPGTGRIAVDAELIDYTGTTPTSFTGATRGAGGTTPSAHPAGNAVYPATTLTANVNLFDTTLPVTSATGVIIPGIVKIGSEYIYCTTATAITFTNCARGHKGTTASAHGTGSTVYQHVLTSLGVVGGGRRIVRVGVDSGASSAIALDRARNSRANNVSSLSWTHQIGGTERYLLVGISLRNNGGQTVTGVNYSGTPLGLLGAVNNGSNVRVELWGLVNPPAVNANVVVTLSASARVVGGSLSFTGVDQAAPIDAIPVFSTGNSGAPAVTITTVTNNAWIVDTLAHLMNANDTVGPGQTEQWNRNTTGGGGGTHLGGAGSTEGPVATPGNVQMSWTLSASRQWALGAVSIRPMGGGTSVLSWQEVIN